MTDNPQWWQSGIVYQIYPRSFADSNADGVGDLPGITAHLDYLRDIGIDALWISPIYPSPMADFGYDISNYVDIEPVFGTLADFDTLVSETHARGMKVILDYVPGHTSNEHPWFVEAQADRTNPKRDWYVWRDPAPDGGVPNNWLSAFGGPAWTFHPHTGQYYLHTHLREQPDLNWRNPELRAAMYDVLRFWMERGVDGFRVDVILRVMKDPQFRDNPPNPDWVEGTNPVWSQINRYNRDWDEVQEVVREMRMVVDEYPERVLIGEAYLPNDRLMRYYGHDLETGKLRGAHLPFNFQLIAMDWDAAAFRAAVDAYEAALPPGAWPNWVLDNHDRHRFVTRYGAENARTATMLLLTLRGTPTCYYGDEIGMADMEIPPERVQDPFEKNVPGIGVGRDPARTPMQWDATPNAGFSPAGVQTWLPVADDFHAVNVASEIAKPDSMLVFFRRLTTLRREIPALSVGNYRSLPIGDPAHIFAYERAWGGRRIVVVLNFGGASQPVSLASACTPTGGAKRPDTPPIGDAAFSLLLSTSPTRTPGSLSADLSLAPHEGLIVEVD